MMNRILLLRRMEQRLSLAWLPSGESHEGEGGPLTTEAGRGAAGPAQVLLLPCASTDDPLPDWMHRGTMMAHSGTRASQPRGGESDPGNGFARKGVHGEANGGH